MTAPRDISVQLTLWQQRKGYSDAVAAHELGVPLVNYKGWRDGKPCRLANLIETAIGVPVSNRALDARLGGGVIRT